VKLRQALITQIKSIFFNPVVEATNINGEKHYFLKLHPRIFMNMMFAFKQKWLYEESVVANENPNFRAMEKLLHEWVTVYLRSDKVFYLQNSNEGAEPQLVDAAAKAQVINKILETFMNVSSDFRTGVARQFTQQIQNSQILTLLENDVIKIENAQLMNPVFNNFSRVVAAMINQEPTLVNRFLKVEKKIAAPTEEVKEQPVSTFDV
jgi:hypothetical protein